MEVYNSIKKETPLQVIFCEYYEIFKNAILTEHIRELQGYVNVKDGFVDESWLTRKS